MLKGKYTEIQFQNGKKVFKYTQVEEHSNFFLIFKSYLLNSTRVFISIENHVLIFVFIDTVTFYCVTRGRHVFFNIVTVFNSI